MDRAINDQPMSALLNDKNRFIWRIKQSCIKDTYRDIWENLKKKQFLDDVIHEHIYSSGSQPFSSSNIDEAIRVI